MNRRADIPAVLLIGGLSSRMGQPKHLLDFGHGPHWKHMETLLLSMFERVYLSGRSEQRLLSDNEHFIQDTHNQIGPLGALSSALQQLADAQAIFIVSCDLPYFHEGIIQGLLHAAEDSEADVVCARGKSKSHPEPLVAIWKRSAYSAIERAIARGAYSLLRLMDQLKVDEVLFPDDWLLNVNRPSDIPVRPDPDA